MRTTQRIPDELREQAVERFMKCPFKLTRGDLSYRGCDPDCAWLLKSVNGHGYCSIAVWAARQEDLPLDECMRFNHFKIEEDE